MLVACASAPPPPAAPAPSPPSSPSPSPSPPAETEHDEEPPAPLAAAIGAPDAGAAPPSTATFEQATAAPEPVGLDDNRVHLTDNQLTEPMRGVLARCRVPANARVTIKTAIQYGRAIGVSVLVELPRPPKLAKPVRPSRRAKAQAKTVARVTACADQAVRALSWPPSRRRDAFTTTF